jgi:hypothetical protein
MQEEGDTGLTMLIIFHGPSGDIPLYMPDCCEEADVKAKARELMAVAYTPVEDCDVDDHPPRVG